ncbi:hypothetical protein ACFQRK_22885 [Parapedobacter sp. GCM10030251]|uniref:hypothetical protein n=1 Tax=Parapedobacter sp. GCM10030251 TaxID=3273419 RepID=UPI003608D8C4
MINKLKKCLMFLFLSSSLPAIAQLPTAGSYIWNATDAPGIFNSKLQLSFVRSDDGFPSFGTVLAGGAYSPGQDGGVFQLYIPYSESFGGNAPRIRLGKYNNAGWSAWQSFYTSANANSASADWNTKNLFVHGNVGIGTTDPQAKLVVNGNILAKEVKVKTDITVPDYVFEPDYELPTLQEVEAYIKEHKHLPEIPSAKDIEMEGLNLAEMNLLLLKKVEELTLHLIEKDHENRQLKERFTSVEQQIRELITNQKSQKP